MSFQCSDSTGLLVLPALNEGKRLPLFLPQLVEAAAGQKNLRLVVVDDGSLPEHKEQMRECVDSLRAKYPILQPMLMMEHLGKGGAIRAGWKLRQSEEWLGFVDSDGAVPVEEVMRSWRICVADKDHGMIMAVRTGDKKTVVKRDFHRLIISRLFNLLVRWGMRTKSRDTQCGLKWVRRTVYDKLEHDLKESGIFLDLELIKKIGQMKQDIFELPINWREVGGGQMGIG